MRATRSRRGSGSKNAALISFGVSFVVILVMAVVSGGDAIFGELPFTIARLSDLLRDLLADDRLDLLKPLLRRAQRLRLRVWGRGWRPAGGAEPISSR